MESRFIASYLVFRFDPICVKMTRRWGGGAAPPPAPAKEQGNEYKHRIKK
jgi:hypothetical protein